MTWEGSRGGFGEGAFGDSEGNGSDGIRGIPPVGGSGARRGGRSSLIAVNLRT